MSAKLELDRSAREPIRDPDRLRAHHRTRAHKFRQKLDILLQVVSLILIAIGIGFVFLLAFAKQPDFSHSRMFALAYLGAGFMLMLFRILIFVLPSRSKLRAQKGSALIYILVLLGVITSAAAFMIARTHQTARLQSQQKTTAALRQAATDAIFQRLHLLADDENLRVDSTNDAWAATTTVDVPGGITIQTRCSDLNSRFDLNNLTAPPSPQHKAGIDILMDVMTACGNLTPSMAAKALQDWVDEDNAGIRETDFYHKLPLRYETPNRMLPSLSEALLIDGWSAPMLYQRTEKFRGDTFNGRLIDCIAVIPAKHAKPIPVNVNTAPEDVLRGLVGFEHESLVDTAVALRASKPIQRLDTLSIITDPAFAESLQPWLDVRSSYFQVDVLASLPEASARLQALAFRDSAGQVSILRWVL